MNIKQLKSKDLSILREKLHKEQNGKCAVTGKPIEDRNAIDHAHSKGLGLDGCVRGLINANMNIYLGKIENNCKRYGISLEELPNTLRQIADYLENGAYIDEDGDKLLHPTEVPKAPKLKKSSYNKLKRMYIGKAKFPEYPKSGKLINNLKVLYIKFNLEPEFY